ncbi:MAG: hypothetical protein ACREDR_00180 [Blastocatellia bacterium]
MSRTRTEFRIVHWNEATMRINGKEYFENVDVGNLVKKEKLKRPGSITFVARVLPGLLAIKRGDQPLLFQRHYGTNWHLLQKQFRNLGYGPARSRLLASMILEAFFSKTYYHGTCWPGVIRNIIRYGSTREGEFKFRVAHSLPIVEGDPYIPGDPSTAFKLHR